MGLSLFSFFLLSHFAIYFSGKNLFSKVLLVGNWIFRGLGREGLIDGTGELPLLVRAVGPALTGLGVSGALGDPTLSLYRGATLLASSDNWTSGPGAAEIAAAFAAVGAFAIPSGGRDAAVRVSLPAGPYTAVVTGGGVATGTALVEVYVVP
jgi:hypothetical protein